MSLKPWLSSNLHSSYTNTRFPQLSAFIPCGSFLCIRLDKAGEEADIVWIEDEGTGTDPRETGMTNKEWEMSRGTNHWSTRSTNNPQGRFCGFHFVFIVRHWPAVESAEPNVADHQIKRFYLCILEGIKHSVTEEVSDTPQASVCDVNNVRFCLHLASLLFFHVII